MSVKEEGIPLMQVFGEEQQSDDDDSDNPFEDEEDKEVETRRPARGHSNKRRHICFGAVLVCALVLVVALVMGFTIPTLIIQNESGTVDHHHGETTGNTRTGTESSMTRTSTSESSSGTILISTVVVPNTNSTQLQTLTSMGRAETLTHSMTILNTQLSQSSSIAPVATTRPASALN